jgi:hypothetical protein
MGDTPSIEFGTIREIKVFKKSPLESIRDRLKGVRIEFVDEVRPQRGDWPEVAIESAWIECDSVAIGSNATVMAGAHDLLYPRQAPAQRTARIVGNLPEHLTQPLTTLRPLDNSQISQERAGFL